MACGLLVASMPQPTERPRVFVPAPPLYGAAFVLGLLLNWIWPVASLSPAIAWLGIPLLGVGGWLATTSRRALTEAGTTTSPWSTATTLVTSGPFRYSRNPLYLARALLYLGLALLMRTPWPIVMLVPVSVVVYYGVIRPEERSLEQTFGEAYRTYRTRVGRWLSLG